MIVIILDKKGWLGHLKGSAVSVTGAKAKDLVSRKVAKYKEGPTKKKEVKSKKDKMIRKIRTVTK